MKLHIDMYINHKYRNCSIINKNGLTAGIGSRRELQQVMFGSPGRTNKPLKTVPQENSCPRGISQLGEPRLTEYNSCL